MTSHPRNGAGSSAEHSDPEPRTRTLTLEHTETGEQRVYSHELLADSSMLTIRHGNQNYYLRVTRAGKLILTK